MAWLGTWAKRIELTISNTNVDAELTNFPVLVYLSASSGTGSSDVSAVFDELTSDANRKKIAVTASDGDTELYVEIEKWDDGNEKAWLWVKVPTVAADAETTLYLYYDSTASDNDTYVGDTTDAVTHNVWDSNFKGVWHMAQDPNGDGASAIKDSTSGGYDGTPAGSMTTADLVAGLMGDAIEFDGSNDKITTTYPGILGSNDRTVECVFQVPTKGLGALVCWGDIQNETGKRWTMRLDDTSGAMRAEINGGYDIATTDAEGASWHYAAHTLTGSTLSDIIHYLAGAVDSTASDVSNTVDTQDDGDVVFAARVTGSSTNYLGCKICEVRISDSVRTAAWIKATNYSFTDGLVAYGAEEEYSAGSYTITMDSGTYALTGTAISLIHNHKIDMGAGSYTLTGSAINLKKVITIIMGSGSYELIGSDLTFSIIAILITLNSIIEQETSLDSEINQEKTLASLIEQETSIDSTLIKGRK